MKKFDVFQWAVLPKEGQPVHGGYVHVKMTEPGCVMIMQEGVLAPLGFGTDVKGSVTGDAHMQVIFPKGSENAIAFYFEPLAGPEATDEPSYLNADRSMESGSLDVARAVQRQVRLEMRRQMMEERKKARSRSAETPEEQPPVESDEVHAEPPVESDPEAGE